MPVVPSAVAPTVAPSEGAALPYQNANGATPDAFGAGIGRATSGFGAQLGQLGDVLEKHALKMQEDVNVSSAKDLFLAGDVEVGKLTVDYNALEGADRVNAYPKFIEDVNGVREKYKQLAPNNDVARRFDQDFARRVGYTIVDGARSAATANKQYQHATNDAVKTNALSHIASNTQDDARFEENLKIGLDGVRQADTYKGASDETKGQLDREFTTSAWATRLQSMAKSDPLRARELLKKNVESMDGQTQLKLKDTIDQQIMNVQSRVDSDKIIQSGALVSPELVDHIKKFEGYSEKSQWDYKQYSSGYGTRAQPGDENIPKEQLKAIHEQRLTTELGRAANIVDNFAPGLPTGTRNALISLTYNAGSAWTSQGLGRDIRAGNYQQAQADLLQYNRAGGEVNAGLVNRRSQEASWFGGEARDVNPVSQMGAALDKAKEQAVRIFPDEEANQAKYLDTLQQRIKTDYNVLSQSARDMQLQMRNVVQKELFDPDHHVVDYDHLSPEAKQMYDQAPPMLQKSFDNAMKQNATADVPLTNERQNRFDALRGEATSPSTTDKFVSRDLNSEDLPRAQKSILRKLQDDKKALLEKGTKMQPYMNSMQADLNDAQIGQSSSDTARNTEYNKFRGVYESAITQFESEKKRAPNEQEGREIGRKLLKDIVVNHGWFGGLFGDNTSRAYRAIADKTPIEVDSLDAARGLPSGSTFVWNGETRVRK